jgi:transcriptional regulator with XRE-family HTH domain
MKEQLRRDVGLRMRRIRKALGYTQEQMVSFFPTGRANYSRIEKGEIFPGPMILNTLTKEFNVSLDWLISDVGEIFHKSNEAKSELDYGANTKEIQDLLIYMKNVPMLKHAVLTFYMEYKAKNKDYINDIYPKKKLEKLQEQDDN